MLYFQGVLSHRLVCPLWVQAGVSGRVKGSTKMRQLMLLLPQPSSPPFGGCCHPWGSDVWSTHESIIELSHFSARPIKLNWHESHLTKTLDSDEFQVLLTWFWIGQLETDRCIFHSSCQNQSRPILLLWLVDQWVAFLANSWGEAIS